MKKLLLFLLSLTLIVTPACRREHKRASLITAGTIATAGGASAASFGILAALMMGSFAIPIVLPIAYLVSGSALLSGGIAMITKGAKIKKKKVKTTQGQEALVWNESDTPREKDIVRPAQSEPVVKPEQKARNKFSRFPKSRLTNS